METPKRYFLFTQSYEGSFRLVTTFLDCSLIAHYCVYMCVPDWIFGCGERGAHASLVTSLCLVIKLPTFFIHVIKRNSMFRPAKSKIVFRCFRRRLRLRSLCYRKKCYTQTILQVIKQYSRAYRVFCKCTYYVGCCNMCMLDRKII